MRKMGSPLQLVLVSQVYMAVLSIPAIVMTWGGDVPGLSSYLVPLLVSTGAYVVGQSCLFIAMRHAQASRISPMLGFKTVVTALITYIFFDAQMGWQQWTGVATAVSAVLVLSISGGRLPTAALLALGGACLSYAVSDIFIRRLIDSVAPLTLMRASFYSTGISYLLCGIAALVVLALTRQLPLLTRGLSFSVPFALSWLTGMFALFTCFGAVGPVLGSILQSSRGVISILLAIPAARMGFPKIEPSSPGHVVIKRLTAAFLIILAVWLYQ